MGLPGSWGRAWLLGAAALLLPGVCCGSGSSTQHSYRVLGTVVSAAEQGISWFSTVAYLDDLLLGVYNSHGKRIVPRVPWMAKLEEEHPQLFQRETKIWRARLLEMGWILEKVRSEYNHSQGFHTLQVRGGCELNAGGQNRGHFQAGYDGEDLVTFDTETLNWKVVDTAENVRRIWENYPYSNIHVKAFLEVGCFEWLQKHLHDGKAVLQRRDPPVVKVTYKESHGGLETLLCQAYGFYPKEINATWRKEKEVRMGDVFSGVVSPNADGTYYIWLSIEIDPQTRNHYQCHVEHDGLQEPVDVAVEESASVPLGLQMGIILIVVILLLVLTGIIFCIIVGKGPFSSLVSGPPIRPASLDADLSCPPASFQRETAGAKLEPVAEGSTPLRTCSAVAWEASGTSSPGDG